MKSNMNMSKQVLIAILLSGAAVGCGNEDSPNVPTTAVKPAAQQTKTTPTEIKAEIPTETPVIHVVKDQVAEEESIDGIWVVESVDCDGHVRNGNEMTEMDMEIAFSTEQNKAQMLMKDNEQYKMTFDLAVSDSNVSLKFVENGCTFKDSTAFIAGSTVCPAHKLPSFTEAQVFEKNIQNGRMTLSSGSAKAFCTLLIWNDSALHNSQVTLVRFATQVKELKPELTASQVAANAAESISAAAADAYSATKNYVSSYAQYGFDIIQGKVEMLPFPYGKGNGNASNDSADSQNTTTSTPTPVIDSGESFFGRMSGTLGSTYQTSKGALLNFWESIKPQPQYPKFEADAGYVEAPVVHEIPAAPIAHEAPAVTEAPAANNTAVVTEAPVVHKTPAAPITVRKRKQVIQAPAANNTAVITEAPALMNNSSVILLNSTAAE